MGKQFDDLSKAMARRISRGQALRGMVGGAFAATLAILIPDRALASSDNSCVPFCQAIYGETTLEARACIVQALHKSGPCYQFGPGSEGCEYVRCGDDQFCVSVNVNVTQGRGYCFNF